MYRALWCFACSGSFVGVCAGLLYLWFCALGWVFVGFPSGFLVCVFVVIWVAGEFEFWYTM